MLEQEMITQAQYDDAGSTTRCPTARARSTRRSPTPTSPTSRRWVTQQAVEQFGADRVFGGGMEIKTTLDPEHAGGGRGGGRADRRRRPVRVARDDRERDRRGEGDGRRRARSARSRSTSPPTATASRARRSSRSSCSPRSTDGRLRPGLGVRLAPARSCRSRRRTASKDVFRVSNYEDQYLGSASLTTATAQSDNSVYAELGMKVGREQGRRDGERDGHPDRSSRPTRRCCSAA